MLIAAAPPHPVLFCSLSAWLVCDPGLLDVDGLHDPERHRAKLSLLAGESASLPPPIGETPERSLSPTALVALFMGRSVICPM